MSEWKNSIVEIEKLEKHPNADSLSIAFVNGNYPVVVRTEDYKVGDLATYICVDTVLPDIEEYHFLSPKAFEQYEELNEHGEMVVKNKVNGFKYSVGNIPTRHRTIYAKRIRSIFSMGLLIPPVPGMSLGDDVSEALGLIKAEEVEEENIPGNKLRGGNAAKPPSHFFIPHYDIESIRKYFDCLIPDEEVVVVEKVHGCVKSDTRLYLPNGKKITIASVKIGDIIMGQGENGQIEPATVTHVFNHGKSKNWLNISGKRENAGRGGNAFSITCTEEHKFFNPSNNSYIRAGDLKEGDDLSIIRTDYFLTPIQEQVLLGKLLGDGSAYFSNTSGAVHYGHCEEQEEYVNFTNDCLGSLWFGKNESCKSGYGSKMFRSKTVYTELIKNYLESFFIDGKKTIPSWVEKKLNPLGIAFWYMDDGSLSHHDGQLDRVEFSTCSFTIDDCNVLIKALEKLDIQAEIKTISNGNGKGNIYNKIYLNANNTEKLFLLISPYIPQCMQYKLSERFRGNTPWKPTNKEYKTPCVTQKILSIKKLDDGFVRHDIETTTHNYFANGILVHNSNSSICHDGEKLWVRSRNFYARDDDDLNSWREAANRLLLADKLVKYPGLAFFGELIGLIPKFRYDTEIIDGRLNTKIKFFDIYDTKSNTYLDHDDFVKICNELELEMAPLLYRGPCLSKEEMYKFAEGQSTLNDKTLKEGFVIKPIKNRFEPKLGGRLQLKCIGEGYMLQKNKK